MVLLNSTPVASCTGSASMSPRSSTAGAGWPFTPAVPRSTAVTDEQEVPVEISRGSPLSASRTACCVCGEVQAYLGPLVQPMPETGDVVGELVRVVAQTVLQCHFPCSRDGGWWSQAKPASRNDLLRGGLVASPVPRRRAP